MERFLVTGAAGFIGSHLCERLLGAGARVVGVDRFSSYYARADKEENLAALKGMKNFEFHEIDLSGDPLEGLLERVDGVFHLAAQAGVRASWGKSFEVYLADNLLATQRLLEGVKGRPVRRFVFASSSSVYGEGAEGPTREDSPKRPLSPYGVTKLGGENLCNLYHQNHGVPAVSLRYFTVYGPRQRPDMAFHRFLEAGLRGEPISLYGDGEQSRDFTYVADAVEGTFAAMEKGGPGAVYNIGGGQRATVNEVLRCIEEIQ
ncbi:MAG: NAD-dependent epimerase/dehydratase family protein, partial [Nitrospinota bacterium]